MTENELLEDRVLIRPDKENARPSGVIVNTKERPIRGEVVLVGPGTKDITMVVEPGYKVVYGEYSGIEIDLDGEKLLLMRQGDIFMITNKTKKDE